MDLPTHISERIRETIARGGGKGIDEEARAHGAIALMGTIGSIFMLRPDDSFWDADADWGKPLAPLAEEWHMRALIWGVERFPWLAELLPARPADAASCPDCDGTGHRGHCVKCGGLGWTPSNKPLQTDSASRRR
jgi:hypothetical protein